MFSRREILAGAAAATAAQTLRVQAAPRPNVVIFLADDLGCHDLGASDLETPNIDALAADLRTGNCLRQVFVSKTFTGDVKGQALAMVKEIEKAMDADLRQLPWMGDATSKKALEKLHAMVNKIGYPDQWRDYSTLRIEPGDFAGNVDRAIEFESRRQLAKIGKPVDRKEWFVTPPTVDAYYNSQTNDMNFPAGVLQPPLFDPKMDDAPNYGNTGGTIGHELTHGFDDQGRQFDAKGNLKDWWTKKDAGEFIQRATCISDQYSQYTVVDEVKING